MKMRVLGCSGAIAKDLRTTSFLLDDDLLVDAGTETVLWARRPELAAAINADHENPDYLPGLPLPAGLRDSRSPMRAIRVGPELLIAQDKLTRARFLKRWDREIAAGATSVQEPAAEPPRSSTAIQAEQQRSAVTGMR